MTKPTQQRNTSEGPNLTRQLKNMLLMRPIYELALTARPTDDAGELLFAGIDTNFLCLSLFDFVMEGSVFDFGRRHNEVLDHLAQKARAMKPEISPEDARKIASKVVDTLHNASNMSRPFEYEFFDSESRQMKRYAFQLLRYSRNDDNAYCYRVTEEGYLVYLGMLDISAEDMQVFLDKLLIHLIQRGKVDEALHISDRSRRESMRYRESIREQLSRAQRSPESVSWRQDLEPFLDSSRKHIDDRKQDGRKLLKVLHEQMVKVSDTTSRGKFQILHESLQGERDIELKLLTEVSNAGDAYRWATKRLFTARRRQSLPNLEEALLPPMLHATATQLADLADKNGYALLSLKRGKQFFLGDMVEALTAERHVPTEATEDMSDVVGLVETIMHFDQEHLDLAEGLIKSSLQGALDSKASISSEAILKQASDLDLPLPAQELALHLLYKLFAYPEPGMRVTTDGRFSSRIANAARLIYTAAAPMLEIEKENE